MDRSAFIGKGADGRVRYGDEQTLLKGGWKAIMPYLPDLFVISRLNAVAKSEAFEGKQGAFCVQIQAVSVFEGLFLSRSS